MIHIRKGKKRGHIDPRGRMGGENQTACGGSGNKGWKRVGGISEEGYRRLLGNNGNRSGKLNVGRGEKLSLQT